jgi:hypothetical protein
MAMEQEIENAKVMPGIAWDSGNSVMAICGIIQTGEKIRFYSYKEIGPDFPGETFRILKEKEEKQFEEYHAKCLAKVIFTPLEIIPRCSAAGLGFRIIPEGFNAPLGFESQRLEFLTGFA